MPILRTINRPTRRLWPAYFGYSERFDADMGAQLFSRPLLGVLQRPVRDHPQLLGGSPQADREDHQNRSENRDYQRSPSVGARGNARSEVEKSETSRRGFRRSSNNDLQRSRPGRSEPKTLTPPTTKPKWRRRQRPRRAKKETASLCGIGPRRAEYAAAVISDCKGGNIEGRYSVTSPAASTLRGFHSRSNRVSAAVISLVSGCAAQ